MRPSLGLVVARVREPVVHEAHAGAGVVGLLERCLHALLPALAAVEAVREDLVDDAVLVPVRLLLALVLVHGDLERWRLAEGEGALAAAVLARGTVAPRGAVRRDDLERVPDDLGLLRLDRDAEAHGNVVPELGGLLIAEGDAVHVQDLLALVVYPNAKPCLRRRLVPDVNTQGNGAASKDGAERVPVLAV